MTVDVCAKLLVVEHPVRPTHSVPEFLLRLRAMLDNPKRSSRYGAGGGR